MLVCGFYDKSFFVFNDSSRVRLLNVPCAGSHRRWSFYTRSLDLSDSVFAYIRNQNLIIANSRPSSSLPNPQINPSFSGLETRAIHFVSDSYFLSGGEDCILRIHSLDSSILESIKNHKASILSICSLQMLNQTLVFTAGAKDTIFAYSWTNSNKCFLIASRSQPLNERVSVRITDISAFESLDSTVILVACCSDGYLRAFSFLDSFKLIQEIEIGKCLLVVESIRSKDTITVVCGSSEGIVRSYHWKSNLLHLVDQVKIHQSGVNSLDLRLIDGGLQILSGGYDGAITCFSLNPNSRNLTRNDFAHGSSVVGVKFLTDTSLVSVSVGSELRYWQISASGFEMKIEEWTCVSDVSGMSISNKLAICGVGLQLKDIVL